MLESKIISNINTNIVPIKLNRCSNTPNEIQTHKFKCNIPYILLNTPRKNELAFVYGCFITYAAHIKMFNMNKITIYSEICNKVVGFQQIGEKLIYKLGVNI